MTTPERRRAERVRADLPVRWEGVIENHDGLISDISVSGCFILTGGKVQDGELISLEMSAPLASQLQLYGTVVYSSGEIGFALRFMELDAARQKSLEQLLAHFKARNANQPNEIHT